ncbi:hypothetical protein EK0264_04660 [Epidermidibacterium keratini]|uniref:Lipoprotein n=1 Tax=Epidermidibacterium keratini TaxID=1891644 RepID=A0A7L4YKA1_9ACTN|nr:hypothetical protein [Epidermidibacterium keratini]QHB99645.1 hypothetical protein EK0264_04660 [Epidermidibacterium keratini]
MTTRKAAVAALSTCVLVALSACSGGSDSNDSKDAATSSSAPSTSSGSTDSTESGSATESYDPSATTGREPIPSTQPDGFDADDLSKVYKFGYILSYVNKYPGWIVLTADAPEYDAAYGGYRVPVYFNAYGGSDIILRSEWSLEVNGQKTVASVSPPADPAAAITWMPERTPIGNHPEATSNVLLADILFVMPQTDQPITMRYDNVDGDVHATWRADGEG